MIKGEFYFNCTFQILWGTNY